MKRCVAYFIVLTTGCVGTIDGDISGDPPAEPPDEAAPIDLDDALELDLAPEGEPLEEEEPPVPILAVAPLLDAEELAFLARINAYRAAHGKAKLRVSIALTRAANAHSGDMAATGHFAHESSDGTPFATRVKRYYAYNTYIGENIAFGYPTADAVFQAWKDSPGHDANMRGTDYRVIGISRIVDADGTSWWTTDFGGYRDAVLSAGFGTIASNGGFESSTITTGVSHSAVRTSNRWHTYGSATRRSGSQAAGSFGLRLADPDPGRVSATQLVRAAAGVHYRIRAQARRVSGTTAQTLYLDFLSGSYERISVVTQAATTATTFATAEARADSPAGTKFVRVILYGPSATGTKSTHDWDAVKVEAY